MSKIFFQKGVISILLSILILSVVLVIALGISFLMLQQIKMSGQIGHSVVAFYAAEAGAERCLYEVRKNGASSCPFSDVPLDFNSNAKYSTSYNGLNTITSIGQFFGTSRKVELTW